MSRIEIKVGHHIPDEARFTHESEASIAGFGLVIISAEAGQLWTIRERKEKPHTAKRIGELSVPLETMKQGESYEDALRGAMAEAFDDVDLEGNDIRLMLKQNILHSPGDSLRLGLTTLHGTHTFHLNYAVFIYDGPNLNVEPYDSEEVGDGMWRDISALCQSDTRPFARIIGQDLIESGAYHISLGRYRSNPGAFVPIFENGFSIRATYAAREKLEDIGHG